MTTTDAVSSPEYRAEDLPAGPASPARRKSRSVSDLAVASGVCVIVALCAQIPRLFTRSFYFTDDSAAQYVPTWHWLGEQLMAGHWPPLLDIDAWAGGNLAAEALFGLWNPVSMANDLLVAQFDDLTTAAAVSKTVFLTLLALGVYLLCREYRAGKAMAAVLAIAVPFTGFVFYFQAVSWSAGLMGLTWVCYVWWSARRAARGRGMLITPFVFGALSVTNGEPYGVLGTVAVLTALTVEFGVRGRRHPRIRRITRRSILRVLVVAVAVAALIPLVFLPLIGTREVGWRTPLLFADGPLRPTLMDLLNMGMPSHAPAVTTFGQGRMWSPGVYFAWFFTLLLPWLDWRVLRRKWRVLGAPLVLVAGYALLTIGPPNLWLWRWPLRDVVMVHLSLAVLVAVLLSAGLRRDHVRRRLILSAALLLMSGYVAFATWPVTTRQHVIAMGVLAALGGLAFLAARRGRLWFAAALPVGTVVVLVLQLVFNPVNRDLSMLKFPTSATQLRAEAADWSGTTVEIIGTLAPPPVPPAPGAPPPPPPPVRGLILGNLARVAGEQGTSSYTGIGHNTFETALCMNWLGLACADAYRRMWQPVGPGQPMLADAMRVETIVVRGTDLPDTAVPAGWQIFRRSVAGTEMHRQAPLPNPRGLLSWHSPNVDVVSDQRLGNVGEAVRVTPRQGTASLLFARLYWPGYRAYLGDTQLTAEQGPAGLLQIKVPAGATPADIRVEWQAPGLTTGFVFAGFGCGLIAVLTVLEWLRRRRSVYL